ncbi:unnamed protein product [Prorocentrum cordatum]|uniref:Uncharacterized protein n=1 Tax=Prorocentrum cordatum TaxID=2364126 RepID=A0ABN9RTI3_9DINO|nr:unnamed protein product [Polarella glacialis]
MAAMSSAIVLSSVTILCAFTLADATIHGDADVAPSVNVYLGMAYPDSECSGSSVHSFSFKKAPGLLDCYVYTDVTGENVSGSFNITCLGDRAVFNDFDRENCTGSIVAWGTTPWAWYTSNTCSSYEYYIQEAGHFIVNESFVGQLASSDYPSTCHEVSGVWAYCPAFKTLLLSVTGVL